MYANITSITKAAPCVITAVSHGVPEGWRFLVTDVLGMKEINSSDNYQVATSVTPDTITLEGLNSSSYTTYTSGGVVSYSQPNNLAGITAKMQIRPSLTSEVILLELTSDNGKLVIDNTAKTITILIGATDTSVLTFASAVYSLELTTIAGEVIQLINGSISLEKEITR